MSRAGQIALITAGAAVTGIVGYCVYFDYMRRNSADFRKGLRKQQKKIKQAAEAREKEQSVRDQRELTLALVELELEQPPSTPERMEAYFQENVAVAEGLAAQGPEHYVKAATHFYRALRVYPQPVELLMIYQKVCPERVFQLVLKLTQLTSGAAAAGAGAGAAASAPIAQASVADIDDSSPTPAAPAAPEVEKAAVPGEHADAAEAAVAAVAAAAAKIEDAEEDKAEDKDEAEAEDKDEHETDSAPASNTSSGAEWERVSNEA